MTDKIITQEYLQSIFNYKDGELYWNVNRSGIQKGDMAGCIDSKGYKRIRLNGKKLLNHRIIFMIHKGYLPMMLDHINGNVLDNKIENLREANRSQNGFNRILKNNTSGFKNVYWHNQEKKWHIRLNIKSKCYSFGLYDDIELAGLVAEEARNKYHGEFARHN
jgi:hypothetical protein